MAGLGFTTALAIGRGAIVDRAGFSFDDATLPAGATLARASAASCHDASGVLTNLPTGAARIDHDAATGAVRGLLIEGEATNLLSWSDGTVAQLVSSGGVIDAPGTIAGFANAIQFGDNSASRYAYKQYVPTAGQTLTLSVVVRMDDGGPPSIGRTSASGDFCMLVGGKVIDQAVAIAAEAGGAYRCAMTYVATNTQSYWGVVRYPAQTARGFRITGLQLENGARATSYIATTDSAATRAADALRLDWSAAGVTDEAIVVRYLFDDHSEAMIAADLAEGAALVPTLTWPWLRRAERW